MAVEIRVSWLMSHHYDSDGALRIQANPFFFLISGLRSAVIGAGLSYFARHVGWQFVSWSILAVFGFWSIRAVVQSFFVPSLLELRFGQGFVEGPKVWWLFRDRVVDSAVDWDVSGTRMGRLILQHDDGNQIYSRLAWYAPEDRALIEEQVAHRRNQNGGSSQLTRRCS